MEWFCWAAIQSAISTRRVSTDGRMTTGSGCGAATRVIQKIVYPPLSRDARVATATASGPASDIKLFTNRSDTRQPRCPPLHRGLFSPIYSPPFGGHRHPVPYLNCRHNPSRHLQRTSTYPDVRYISGFILQTIHVQSCVFIVTQLTHDLCGIPPVSSVKPARSS